MKSRSIIATILLIIPILFFYGCSTKELNSPDNEEINEGGNMSENGFLQLNNESTLKWLGHASFRIVYKGLVLYIDPFQLKDTTQKADMILITHGHYDHCSLNDIKNLMKSNTTIIMPEDCSKKLAKELDSKKIIPFSSGKKLDISGINITAIPSYNLDKDFHPKSNGWLGYVINLGGLKLYHAGDTDLIPEMKGLDVDVALLPVGGTYTMDAKEAAKACDAIKPKMYAIPMHYKSIVGSETNAYEFKQNTKCEVKIL